MNNSNYYDPQVFPTYPNPLVSCPLYATICLSPSTVAGQLQSDISAFAHDFRTPRVQQASLSLEREMANRLAAGISYMYVHGIDLIRARDVKLPPPTAVAYPIYDDSGINFLGTYYNLDSFSTW
jgi:hypothetical protein